MSATRPESEMSYDVIEGYLKSLKLFELYMGPERDVADQLLSQFDLSPDMREHFEDALYCKAVHVGINAARHGYNNNKPRITEIGLGIATTFAETRGTPIVVGNGRLDECGLGSAHTSTREFAELSRFTRTHRKPADKTYPIQAL